MNRAIALFDFDGTLVTGDSLPTFIACCVGWPRTVATALFAALVTLRAADRRTAFKALWLRLTLRGFPLARLPEAQEKLAQKGIFPSVARPAPTPIIFASATPTLTKFAGCFFATSGFVPEALLKSASRQRTLGFSSISSLSVRP